jgi:hypothetical protein
MQYQELPNGPYKNATGAVVQSWMPEHWYSNQYLVGSQTTAGGAVASGGGGYGGRGFFDEQALTVRRQQQVRKRHFLRHLYIKCIILPRQARDKHRENSKKCRFLAAA